MAFFTNKNSIHPYIFPSWCLRMQEYIESLFKLTVLEEQDFEPQDQDSKPQDQNKNLWSQDQARFETLVSGHWSLDKFSDMLQRSWISSSFRLALFEFMTTITITIPRFDSLQISVISKTNEYVLSSNQAHVLRYNSFVWPLHSLVRRPNYIIGTFIPYTIKTLFYHDIASSVGLHHYHYLQYTTSNCNFQNF